MRVLAALAVAAAVPILAADTPSPPAPPTPQEIYAAARVPFAGMVKAYGLKQDFYGQSDGTYLGVVKPTFEQEKSTLATSHEHFSNIVGSWEAVTNRVGSVHEGSGQLVSIEKAFGITDERKTPFLVVASIDSTAQPGKHVCVDVLIGVGEQTLEGTRKPELLPTRYGALIGCGIVKNVLAVAHPDLEENASSLEEYQRLHFALDDAIYQALGLSVFRKEIKLREPNPLSPDSTEKGGRDE